MSDQKNREKSGPSSQPKKKAESPENSERRRLLKLSVTTASLGLAGAALGSLVVRVPIPAILPGPSSLVKIGDASDFPVGVEREIEEAKLIVRSDEAGISAMSLICTHLGCIVKQTNDGFSCPCHGSKFAPDGKVLKGPAPRSLPWFRVSQLPSKKLVVDTKRSVPMGTKVKMT